MHHIEQMNLRDLKPWPRHARTHSQRHIRQLSNSIQRFGFTNPVLIDEDNYILAGHGRVCAATKLGLAYVPCLRIPHLSAIEKGAYILADNKLALNATWDGEELSRAFECMSNENASIDEVDDIETQAKSPPEAGVAITTTSHKCERGDIWQLGPHCLVCDDSLDIAVQTALLGSEHVDMFFSTPPHVPYDGTRPSNEWISSILIAASRSGRRAFLNNSNPKDCEIIILQWEAHTSRKAVRVT